MRRLICNEKLVEVFRILAGFGPLDPGPKNFFV